MMPMAEKAKVLIVDDNEGYRAAFRRNLLMHDYRVCEAEDMDEALEVLKQEKPDVLVTDLRMRTPTEGLDLIKQVKDLMPLVPLVMISAVGTFEEGARATQLGAAAVISKSHIDDELDYLFQTIDKAHVDYKRNLDYMQVVNEAKWPEEGKLDEALANQLRQLLVEKDADPYIKGEAFDALMQLEERRLRSSSQQELAQAVSPQTQQMLEQIEADFQQRFPHYLEFHADSRESLKTAEFFYRQQSAGLEIDFSRNIGFSFSFAVENEAKVRLRKKLFRFLTDTKTYQLISDLMDQRIKHINIFFHQYLLRLQQSRPFEFTIDNVKQTFDRIKELQKRYKPDGLKALGIVIVCFGRQYTVKKMDKVVKIDNPLGIKGLDAEDEILDFAQQLVLLQHYRNPYIHPEISEMEKISKLREATFTCLKYIERLR